MGGNELLDRIDPVLMSRLAALSPGAQRWLKTAVQAIRTMPSRHDGEAEAPKPLSFRRRQPKRGLPPPAERESAPNPSPPGLEDVITGKARLEDLDQYPDLAGELEGLGEIIDMLRGLGEARRKRGEEILREEILGSPEKREPAEDEEDDFHF